MSTPRKAPTRAEHNAANAILCLFALALAVLYAASCRHLWLLRSVETPGNFALSVAALVFAAAGTLTIAVTAWEFVLEPFGRWLWWAADTEPADDLGDDFE